MGLVVVETCVYFGIMTINCSKLIELKKMNFLLDLRNTNLWIAKTRMTTSISSEAV